MPHSLTERQKEVLLFIRKHIFENESSPRLEEIADYFGVKPPTAHKYLAALQKKGYLIARRTSSSGFYIRILERAGEAESITEINITGWVDSYGELLDFPSEIGHFATTLIGAKPENLFALVAMENLPEANILINDFIIFDMDKEPQPGDIIIGPIGSRLFLTQIDSRTFDERTPALVMKQDYPIPEALLPTDRQHHFHWHTLAYTEETDNYFMNIADEERFQIKPIPREFIPATALRLIRALSY